MSDAYDRLTPGLSSPAIDAQAITPGSALLSYVTRALYVGTGGDLAIELASGTQVTLKGVPGGAVLPVRVRKVLAAGTSATDVVGFW